MRAIAPRPRPGSATEAPRPAPLPAVNDGELSDLRKRLATAEATITDLRTEQGRHAVTLEVVARDLEAVKQAPREVEKPEVFR